jgi:hypothetical protein
MPEQLDRCLAVITGVDDVVVAMERKWGIGRLPMLVSDETRLRFRQASQMWHAAIESYEPERVQQCGAMMRRAWAALDQEAGQAGHKPLAPEVWEARLPDGSILCLVRTAAEAHLVAADRRDVKVMALDEAARLIAKGADIQTEILLNFPGAIAVPPRVLPPGYAEDWARDRLLTDTWFGPPKEVLQRAAHRTAES